MLGAGQSVENQDKDKGKDKQKQKQKCQQLVSAVMEDQNKQKQKKQQKQKQKEKKIKQVQKQNKNSCKIHIFPFDIAVQLQALIQNNQNNEFNQQKRNFNQEALTQNRNRLQDQNMISNNNNIHNEQIISSFPLIQKFWYTEYLQNKLSYLTAQNQIQMMDICKYIDGKHIGKQWVNLGYRFQPLQSNDLYEQLQDQFQLTAEQNGSLNNNNNNNHNNNSSSNIHMHTHMNGVVIKNRINQLNDWSYCLLPREAVIGKTIRRLNCIQF